MKDSHPEPAEIAALDAGLLPAEQATRLRRHLSDCPSCAGIQADLTALRHELRDLPVPPLPDSVAERIDAALAAEADNARRPHSQPHEVTVSRETTPRRSWPRVALAAAAAIVALGVGSAVIQTLDTGADKHGSKADTAAQGSEEAAGAGEAGAGSEPEEALEIQVRELLARSGTAGTESPEMFDDARTPQSDPSAGSDTADPMAPLPGETGPTQESASSPTSPPAETTLLSLPLCVRAAIDRQETPLAAGEEDYRGQMAYLVVLPHRADPDRVDAYVIDADCVTASPASTGEVLVRESYPR